MKNNLKIGQLVYLKNVGFPFDKDRDGDESWEGASCIVTALNDGYDKDMVRVEPLIPVKCKGGNGTMDNCLFHPERVKIENRPWLKKHLKDIFRIKRELLLLSRSIEEQLS